MEPITVVVLARRSPSWRRWLGRGRRPRAPRRRRRRRTRTAEVAAAVDAELARRQRDARRARRRRCARTPRPTPSAPAHLAEQALAPPSRCAPRRPTTCARAEERRTPGRGRRRAAAPARAREVDRAARGGPAPRGAPRRARGAARLRARRRSAARRRRRPRARPTLAERAGRRRRGEAALAAERAGALEQVAGLTAAEAQGRGSSRTIETQAKREAALTVREIEREAKDEGEDRARRIVTLAAQRIASEQTAESTVSVLHLPDDSMKGRIIGREGRNIRTFEAVTGVNLLIDDTPEAVLLSSFDPVRREVARITLEALVADGRIQPSRIEERVRAQPARGRRALRPGRRGRPRRRRHRRHAPRPHRAARPAALSARRTARTCSATSSSAPTSPGIMAAELRLPVEHAKRCALLHDIGKALTHEVEGSHALIGAEVARRYGEHEDVVHAIEAHHNEVEVRTLEAVLTQTADSMSGGRPGARRESLEHYVERLERLEQIASSYAGVEKVFAMQAGREVRVVVLPGRRRRHRHAGARPRHRRRDRARAHLPRPDPRHRRARVPRHRPRPLRSASAAEVGHGPVRSGRAAAVATSPRARAGTTAGRCTAVIGLAPVVAVVPPPLVADGRRRCRPRSFYGVPRLARTAAPRRMRSSRSRPAYAWHPHDGARLARRPRRHRLPTRRTVVALTFDGGGNAASVARVLATLASNGIHAHVLPHRQLRARTRRRRARSSRAGHVLGNHTDTHPDALRISDAACARRCAAPSARSSPPPG